MNTTWNRIEQCSAWTKPKLKRGKYRLSYYTYSKSIVYSIDSPTINIVGLRSPTWEMIPAIPLSNLHASTAQQFHLFNLSWELKSLYNIIHLQCIYALSLIGIMLIYLMIIMYNWWSPSLVHKLCKIQMLRLVILQFFCCFLSVYFLFQSVLFHLFWLFNTPKVV